MRETKIVIPSEVEGSLIDSRCLRDSSAPLPFDKLRVASVGMTKIMRIGIDCRTILNPGFGEHAGIGHYTYYLVTNLLKIDKKNLTVVFG